MEEVDVDVQTDAFLDRPPSPLFIPAKTGIDQATQIQNGDVKFYAFMFSYIIKLFFFVVWLAF